MNNEIKQVGKKVKELSNYPSRCVLCGRSIKDYQEYLAHLKEHQLK